MSFKQLLKQLNGGSSYGGGGNSYDITPPAGTLFDTQNWANGFKLGDIGMPRSYYDSGSEGRYRDKYLQEKINPKDSVSIDFGIKRDIKFNKYLNLTLEQSALEDNPNLKATLELSVPVYAGVNVDVGLSSDANFSLGATLVETFYVEIQVDPVRLANETETEFYRWYLEAVDNIYSNPGIYMGSMP